MPRGIPNLGCSEEGNFIQCKQFNCETVQLWKQEGSEAPLQLDSPALLLASLLCLAVVCTGLLWLVLVYSTLVRHLWCFSSAGGK